MKNAVQQDRLRRCLEAVTNIAVLLVFSLLVSILMWNYLAPEPRPQFSGGLQKGKKLECLASLNKQNSLKTLLIAISPECAACSESVSFYRELAHLGEEHKTVDVRAFFTGQEGAVREFFLRNQLDLDAVPLVDSAVNDIAVTPTIILADADGTILDFWVGELTEEDKRQIIHDVNRSNVMY